MKITPEQAEKLYAWLYKKTIRTRSCWNFKGHVTKEGYGAICKKKYGEGLAHRYSYKLAHGSIPVGMCVLHRCDNRKCVRPDHLWAGTVAENNEDMLKKGRQKNNVGEAHGMAKIKAKDVLEIRRRYKSGESNRSLSIEFGISLSQTKGISSGRYWKCL